MQQSSLSIVHAPAGSVGGSRSSTLVGALMAGFLGLVVIWGVGLSQIDVIHNAAHDTRHSNAFPCH